MTHMQAFHDHLDACSHCRENVFDLCGVGRRLLINAALSLALVQVAEPLPPKE